MIAQTISGSSILEHLIELRKRLLVGAAAFLMGMVVAFVFNRALLRFLLVPFEAIAARSSGENLLYVMSLLEGFVTKIKLSAVAGLAISMPVHIWNVVRFTFPGLTLRERRVISASLLTSSVLIIVSFYYGYYKVIPVSVAFLSSSGFIPEDIGMILSYGRNIFYVLQFLLATMIMFQVPIVIEILMMMDVISRKSLLKYSRQIIVGTFLLSALVTPPDIVSQLSLSLPLIVLFFLAILIARIFGFGKGR